MSASWGSPPVPARTPGPPVPAPPQGPGVVPPFPAPPTDRDYKGLWIGLGVGGLVLALCCVGGIFGFGFLASGSNQLVAAQAREVATSYLQALEDEKFPAAYELVCRDLTQQLSLSAFEDRVGRPRIVEFQVTDTTITNDAITVRTTVRRQGGDDRPWTLPMTQDGMSGLKICGL